MKEKQQADGRQYPFCNLIDDGPEQPKVSRHPDTNTIFIENYDAGVAEAKAYLEEHGLTVKGGFRTYCIRVMMVTEEDCPILGGFRELELKWRDTVNLKTIDSEYYTVTDAVIKQKGLRAPHRYWAGEALIMTVEHEGFPIHLMMAQTDFVKALAEHCAINPIPGLKDFTEPYVHIGAGGFTQRVAETRPVDFRHWGTIVESPIEWFNKFGTQLARSKGDQTPIKGFISGREAMALEEQAKGSKTIKQIMGIRDQMKKKTEQEPKEVKA